MWIDRIEVGASAPPANLVSNGDFEAGISGWGPWGGGAVVSHSTDPARGAGALKTVSPAGEGCQCQPVLPRSTAVTVSLWVYVPVLTHVAVGIYQPDPWLELGSHAVSVPANVWTRIEVSGVTTAVASAFHYIAVTGQFPTGTLTVYVDDVYAYPTATPPTVELPLDEVLADAVIRHGRAGIDDPPTASTCQIRLQHVTAEISGNFRVGVSIVVEADGAPRFTGTVTDASLDDDVLTIIGVGPLSTLRRYEVGAAPWPAEAWHLRVERAFAEAGLSELLLLQYDADYDPELLARGTVLEPEDPTDLYSYLGQLATDVGAAIADTPDGRVLVQELAARLKLAALAWISVPTSLSWAEVDPGCSWEEATTLVALDPSAPVSGPVTIDPADVLYVPVWEMVDEIENVSTVEYGVDLAVTEVDETSVTLYGERPGGVSTQLALPADALKRAEDRVGRRAFPRWVIRSVPLLRAYTVAVGQIANLSKFPPPSPHEDWSPVIEGWTDTIEGDLWLQELAVTDPLLSGVALLWLQVPADISWAEVDPATNWTEATTLASLTLTTMEV